MMPGGNPWEPALRANLSLRGLGFHIDGVRRNVCRSPPRGRIIRDAESAKKRKGRKVFVVIANLA
jgi:hypothetical protein